MSRAMMLVSAEGATMAETRVDDEGTEANAAAAVAQLREEAQVSGFSEEESGPPAWRSPETRRSSPERSKGCPQSGRDAFPFGVSFGLLGRHRESLATEP